MGMGFSVNSGRVARAICVLFGMMLIAGCGSDGSTSTENLAAELEQAVSWPSALPSDAVQPWEASDKESSSINASSEFVAGVERFLEGGSAVDNGEATALDSATESISYAMYRVSMDGAQPGAVSLDVNLHEALDGSLSGYYAGLADYSRGCWEWHGPFTDSHIRLSTGAEVADGASYLSDAGNLFVCVVAYDGAAMDVVGVSANPTDATDTEAPPVPQGVYAQTVYGGLELHWDDVVAGDLAGYRVYHSSASFDAIDATNVRCIAYLAGQGRHLITGLTGEVWARVSAVDITGNESDLSAAVQLTVLTGETPDLRVEVSAVSGLINDEITVSASGASTYDWDLDGDGVYDVTGDTTGTQLVDTGAVGIIRPAVRGTGGDSVSVACGAVSLLISSNSRPAASAVASPQSGDVPLDVSFTGTAEDVEDALEDLTFAWDFDGDGIFEENTNTLTPAAYTYTAAGIYGAKLRVMDTYGSWDVDTVPVQVNAVEPGNNAPTADVSAAPTSGDVPLAVSLNAAGSSDDDGSIVNYEWDFDGDGLYDGNSSSATVAHTYTEAGIFTAQVRVTDDDGAQATDTVEITATTPGNTPPVAVVTHMEAYVDDTLEVYFDAIESYDEDGTIADYEWDFDGDGVFNESGEETTYRGDVSTGKIVYTVGPPFEMCLRVTDNGAASNTTTHTITVHGIVTRTVYSTGTVGMYNSICLVDGCPAIGFYDETNGDLMYVRAADANGVSWNTPLTLDSDGDVGKYTTLLVVDGYPAISYYDGTNEDLKYVRASDAQGGGWGSPVTPQSSGSVGTYASMAIVNGYPAISYYGAGTGNLVFKRATNAQGTGWGDNYSPAITGDVGIYTSLAVVDGCPAISYYDIDNQDLMYVRATDAQGTSWGTPVTVDSSGEVGQHTSLLVVDGRPAISYFDDTNNELRYVRAADAQGTSWGTPVTVDSDGSCGKYNSMAIVNGYPAISYLGSNPIGLDYVCATNAQGTSWGTPVTVDSNGLVGGYTSLMELEGTPAICYFDYNNENLKFARVY